MRHPRPHQPLFQGLTITGSASAIWEAMLRMGWASGESSSVKALGVEIFQPVAVVAIHQADFRFVIPHGAMDIAKQVERSIPHRVTPVVQFEKFLCFRKATVPDFSR